MKGKFNIFYQKNLYLQQNYHHFLHDIPIPWLYYYHVHRKKNKSAICTTIFWLKLDEKNNFIKNLERARGSGVSINQKWHGSGLLSSPSQELQTRPDSHIQFPELALGQTNKFPTTNATKIYKENTKQWQQQMQSQFTTQIKKNNKCNQNS